MVKFAECPIQAQLWSVGTDHKTYLIISYDEKKRRCFVFIIFSLFLFNFFPFENDQTWKFLSQNIEYVFYFVGINVSIVFMPSSYQLRRMRGDKWPFRMWLVQ